MAEGNSAFTVYRNVTAGDFHGAAYQESVLALRNGPYLEFPSLVGVETLSLCNAACEFCPYPSLERQGQMMPDALIEKILTEIQEIPNRPPFHVTLSRVNEPFLDSRILDISLDIERRFPEATNNFISNGSPLNEKNLLGLSRLQRVGFLVISVNDHRPNHYERVMRLPYAKTIARLNLIHAMKSSGVLKFQIYLTRVGDGSPADSEFLEWVKSRYPVLNGVVTVRGDWMRAVSTQTGPVPDMGCRAWFQLHFLSTGTSPFCCADSDGRHGFGDARNHHVIHEIYNHPDKKRLREEVLSRLQVSVCRSCSFLP